MANSLQEQLAAKLNAGKQREEVPAPQDDLEKVQDVLRKVTGDDALEVTPETRFHDIALDSLSLIEAVVRLENALGVRLDSMEGIEKVDDLLTRSENKGTMVS